MLHLPKNDRILFAFFGISLVSRRRSRASEARAAVLVKNRLLKVLGSGQDMYKSVLLRDLQDIHYPDKRAYPDLEKLPRWKEFIAAGQHPLGLRVHSKKYYAYVDREKKEWDFTNAADLLNRQGLDDEERSAASRLSDLVGDTWKFLPRANQAHFHVDALLPYSSIALVDDQGDVLYQFPHLYVEFNGRRGPFDGFWERLQRGEEFLGPLDEFKRVHVFPKEFKPVPIGTFHEDRPLKLGSETLAALRKYEPLDTLYETDGRYAHLQQRDVVGVEGVQDSDDVHFQVTHSFSMPAKEYLDGRTEWKVHKAVEVQLGRKPADGEVLNIYEVQRIYKWRIEELRQGEDQSDGAVPRVPRIPRKRKPS